MGTFRSQSLATAALLLIALVWSAPADAQITMRGYLDLRPQPGPLVLVGDRGFSLLTSYSFWNNASGIFNCNTSPNQCVPGATLNLRAVHNDESAIVTLDGKTYSPVGGNFDNDSFEATFDGSLTLPAMAPTAIASTSFTFQGRFTYTPSPGQPVTFVDLAGSGLADVYLRRYSDPSFPNSWYVERVVYRFNQAPIPALLTYTDVGAVGVAGGARFSNGDFIVSGSGGDIWGTADAFHYLFKALDSGGSVSAKVMSLSASQPFAKAGVMLRGGLGADAAHVLLDVKPDGGVEFMTRSATGGNTTYIAGATASFPVWLRLTVKGSAVTALISSDARSWQTVGTTTIDNTGASWRRTLGGFAVTSHDNQAIAQAAFQEPSVGLDWPWTQADIGAMTRFDANAEFVDLSYIVSGTGADIWGTADAFHFMYQPHQSDGLIVARVDSEQDTNPFAKAGIMIRDATGQTDPGAKYVVLDVRPNGAVEFMARTATGGSTAYLGGTTRAFPVWLKLERHGDTITGFTSADGSAWISVGSIDVTVGTIPNFGVAVTSHDTSTLNTARIGTLFVQTTAPDAPPPPPPPAPGNVVVYASDIPSSAMHGVWAPHSDSTSPNGIKLTTPAGSAANTSAPLSAPADYVDVPFTSATNTPYTLWIRVRAANDSKLSDSLWVQFSDAIANGSPVYPIGTTSGLLVNLATDSTASSIHNWGWVNGAYWLSQPATFTFSSTTGTLRIQPREYGVEIDQIVLSPGTYMNPNASCPNSCGFAPGPLSNDTTTVPKP